MTRARTIFILLLVLGGVCWWQRARIVPVIVGLAPAAAPALAQITGVDASKAGDAHAASRDGQAPAPAAVPVTSAQVRQGDFPVYLNGLGIVQAYDTPRLTVSHYDLYRLKRESELEELGLDEALDQGAALIEWPERAQSRLPADALTAALDADRDRRAVLEGPARWKDLERAYV